MTRILITALLFASILTANSQHLTILHSNDTHSQIDPTDAPEDLGGVIRRKAIIDSVRNATPNPVMLVDAGDAVQGTMLFTLFGGEVEQKLLNHLGYDIQILGNHEFDNGIERLAANLRNAKPVVLSTNYDVDSTALRGLIHPYYVREIDGKKIGFIAINIEPAGLIDYANWKGLRYLDGYDAANAMAWYLKHIEKVDRVVAITHIGWDDPNGLNDQQLASRSKDIDVIIGGHSHTLLNPAPYVPNATGDSVLVVQTGSKGRWLGQVDIDLSENGSASSKLYKLTASKNKSDEVIEAIISPYRQKADSVGAVKIGRAAIDFPQDSQQLLNLLSDFVAARGEEISGANIDIAIMNKGGIRNGLSKGSITKGDIMTMLPFDNKIVVLELKGKDLLENIEIMCSQNGQGVSSGVYISYGADLKPISATIDGKPVEPDRIYRVATISYLANAGDYMKPLTRGHILAQSDSVIFNDIIDSLEHGALKGRKLKADDNPRMYLKK